MPAQAPMLCGPHDLTLPLRGAELRQRDQRLQGMKALVAQLAHTFNNSLAPLAGYVNLLGEEVQPETPGVQYLNRMEASVKKTEGVIEAILHATHPERHFAPRRVDLAALLHRSIEGWMKALPGSSSIAVSVNVVPCTLWLDEGQWTKVIHHLLRNAQSALSAGGALNLTLEMRTLTPVEAAELEMNDANVFQLVLEDTGCGMSDEVLAQAFDPLFTTYPYGPTAGLGLTLVHSVVKLHSGQLAIASSEQDGTIVTIWLPAAVV